MQNLNTHAAYRRLREERAAIRAAGKRPTGYELAGTLDRYSERGEAYVESLRSIMHVNRLAPADDIGATLNPSRRAGRETARGARERRAGSGSARATAP